MKKMLLVLGLFWAALGHASSFIVVAGGVSVAGGSRVTVSAAVVITDPWAMSGCLGFWYADNGYSAAHWNDACPSGNNAAPAGGLSMPSQVLNQINGKAILRFANNPIRPTSNTLAKGTGFTYVWVGKFNSYVSGNNISLSSDYTGNPNSGQIPFFNYSVAEGGWEFVAKATGDFQSFYATIPQDTTTFHSVVMSCSGTVALGNCALVYDGVSKSISALASPGYIVTPAVLSGAEFPPGTAFASTALNADVGATGVFDHQFSGTELNNLLSWIRNYYGGTLAATFPRQREIVQRDGSSNGVIPISGTSTLAFDTVQAQAVNHSGFGSTTIPWTTIYSASPNTGSFSGNFTVPAGWWDIAIRTLLSGSPVLSTSVNQVGIGEILLFAGQSNSGGACYGQSGYTATDERVNANVLGTGTWTAAADVGDCSDNDGGGSHQGRLGDLLAARLNMPIGLVALAQGNTASSQWTSPGGTYYPRIKNAVQAFPVNGFRALLWQQGENDAALAVSQGTYYSNVSAMISQSRTDAGWSFPYAIATASYYCSGDAGQEAAIAAAQAQLVANLTNVFAGLNADALTGANRYVDGASNCVHFSTTGLAAEASGWASVLEAQFSW
jgi:hypothetical protein